MVGFIVERCDGPLCSPFVRASWDEFRIQMEYLLFCENKLTHKRRRKIPQVLFGLAIEGECINSLDF